MSLKQNMWGTHLNVQKGGDNRCWSPFDHRRARLILTWRLDLNNNNSVCMYFFLFWPHQCLATLSLHSLNVQGLQASSKVPKTFMHPLGKLKETDSPKVKDIIYLWYSIEYSFLQLSTLITHTQSNWCHLSLFFCIN